LKEPIDMRSPSSAGV